MLVQTVVALGLTLVSACLINWGYLREHDAAAELPVLSPRVPLRSLRLLLGSRRWLVGFGAETAGFALYVAAVALAPLALVQAVAAGGIGVLALFVARTTSARLDPRERGGVLVAVAGLMLLGISLAGGAEAGVSADLLPTATWLAGSAAAAALLVGSGAARLGGGAAFGLAAGVLFGAGDVSTKVMVDSGGHVAVAPAVIGFYSAGTIVLQMGFQRGRALTAAGIATLATNAIPIAAAMTLFGEPLPDGPLGGIRIAAFAAVVTGAVALAPRSRAAEAEPGPAPPQPSAVPPRSLARARWGVEPMVERPSRRRPFG